MKRKAMTTRDIQLEEQFYNKYKVTRVYCMKKKTTRINKHELIKNRSIIASF